MKSFTLGGHGTSLFLSRCDSARLCPDLKVRVWYRTFSNRRNVSKVNKNYKFTAMTGRSAPVQSVRKVGSDSAEEEDDKED